jgi:hypothetical protein
MGLNESTSKKSGADWSEFHILNGYIAEKIRTWVGWWKHCLNMEIGEERGRNDDGVGLA